MSSSGYRELNDDDLGAACNTCNLQIQIPDFVPIILHNLSGYDAHIIMNTLTFDDSPIDVIQNTTENYISFTKDMGDGIKFRFIDSFRFMASGLETLAKKLSTIQFRHVRTQFSDAEQFLLAHRKGVFPYEYINTWERLAENQLRSKEHCYSQLKGEHITDEDYMHANRVWIKFNIQNLGEYSDLYLKIDVLFLTDIFENFRDLCMKNHGLDSACFQPPGYHLQLP